MMAHHHTPEMVLRSESGKITHKCTMRYKMYTLNILKSAICSSGICKRQDPKFEYIQQIAFSLNKQWMQTILTDMVEYVHKTKG